MGGGVLCPVEFDAKDSHEMMVLREAMIEADGRFRVMLGEDGSVLPENYDHAMAFMKDNKEEVLAEAKSVEEWENIMNHWPWDDMDEGR